MKKKKENEIDKLFGEVCIRCNKRHLDSLATNGHNLPKSEIQRCTG